MNHLQRAFALALVASVGLLSLAACKSSGSSKSGTKVAAAAPIHLLVDTSLTASAAQGGVSFPWPALGAKAAAKSINAAGGIDGHKIIISVCDNKGDPNVSAQCARTASSEKDLAVVGSFDGFGATQLLPVLKSAGIPYVGGLPTAPAEFENSISFQFDPGAVLGGPALSQLMVDKGCKSVVILAPAIPGEPQTLAGQKAYLTKNHVKVSSVNVPTTATDVSPVVSQALASKPDCITFAGQGQLTAQMIQSSHRQGFTGKFVTAIGSLLPPFLAVLGKIANGVIVNASTLLPTSSDPMVTAYRNDMTAYLGAAKVMPNLNEFSQDGWSSVQLIKQALTGAKTVSSAALIAKLPTMCDVNVGNVYPHVNFCKGGSSKDYPRTYNDQWRYLVAKDGRYVESDSAWHDAAGTVAG